MSPATMKKMIALVSPALLAPLLASAAPAEKETIKEVSRYEGSWNGWIDKVCIGDQLYLVAFQAYGPSAITPALREGKPEQCEGTSTTKKDK